MTGFEEKLCLFRIEFKKLNRCFLNREASAGVLHACLSSADTKYVFSLLRKTGEIKLFCMSVLIPYFLL